jgi:hypothetical protein
MKMLKFSLITMLHDGRMPETNKTRFENEPKTISPP